MKHSLGRYFFAAPPLYTFCPPFFALFFFFFPKSALDPEGVHLSMADSDGDNEAIAEICTADDAARLQQPYSTYLRVDARRVEKVKSEKCKAGKLRAAAVVTYRACVRVARLKTYTIFFFVDGKTARDGFCCCISYSVCPPSLPPSLCVSLPLRFVCPPCFFFGRCFCPSAATRVAP